MAGMNRLFCQLNYPATRSEAPPVWGSTRASPNEARWGREPRVAGAPRHRLGGVGKEENHPSATVMGNVAGFGGRVKGKSEAWANGEEKAKGPLTRGLGKPLRHFPRLLCIVHPVRDQLMWHPGYELDG